MWSPLMSTDLPPEAFTKETLQAAFDWLQTQPEAVRGTVHTPEYLVSLFRKSQRLNDKDHPVSSKKFITDLKTLATSLDQFSDNEATNLNTAPVVKKEPIATAIETPQLVQQKAKATLEMTMDPYDDVTQARVSQVKERFNLSSDQEALRLLVSLGYEKFSQFS